MIITGLFYFFSTLLLLSALCVVTARQPVHAVVALVFAFVASSVLWLLMEAEFLSLLLLFVYVGAVMTLFLFIVMMLDLSQLPMRRLRGTTLLTGLGVVGTLLAVFYRFIHMGYLGIQRYPLPAPKPADYSNITEIGQVLYTQYVFAFELAGVVLLVAIVAAVGITFRGPRAGTLRQRVADQVAVDPASRLRIVKMPAEKKP